MISEQPVGICGFCGLAIYRADRVYYEVLGWEEERRQGGTNALRLRQRTGTKAHWVCVDRAAHGRTGQETLLP